MKMYSKDVVSRDDIEVVESKVTTLKTLLIASFAFNLAFTVTLFIVTSWRK